MTLWVQIWCICPNLVFVTMDHLIGLEVRMNKSIVKIISFFVNSQDNVVKRVESPKLSRFQLGNRLTES